MPLAGYAKVNGRLREKLSENLGKNLADRKSVV